MKRKINEASSLIPDKKKKNEEPSGTDQTIVKKFKLSPSVKHKKQVIRNDVSTETNNTSDNKSVSKNSKHSKKWKNWNKKKKKSKTLKETTKDSETKSKPEISTKRVQIPKEISNNWKTLHEVILKDQKIKKETHGDKVKKKIPEKKSFSFEEKKDPKVIDIWFDGVDEMLLDIEARKAKRLAESNQTGKSTLNPLVKPGASDGLTKMVAMDCEMVGVGVNGGDSMLARVSIVNKFGHCIYDKYVKPMENVVDYRTFVSGITPDNIKDGEEFFTVQKEVNKIIKGRILVGHALSNDLKVLYLQHDKKNIRDTSKYKGYRSLFGFKTPSLKKLTKEVLGIDIQDGEHDSVQDAQAAMRLYTMYRKQWEKDIKIQRRRQRIRKKQENSKT